MCWIIVYHHFFKMQLKSNYRFKKKLVSKIRLSEKNSAGRNLNRLRHVGYYERIIWNKNCTLKSISKVHTYKLKWKFICIYS